MNCGYCGSDKLCAFKDDMTALYNLVLEADIIVATTPVYMWNMSGLLKTFYDRLHCYSKKYTGKTMGVIVTGAGDLTDSGCDIIEDSLKRFCDFCGIGWAGMLFEQYGHGSNPSDDDRTCHVSDFLDIIKINNETH
jgi:multimeric flavodoxin WrbA